MSHFVMLVLVPGDVATSGGEAIDREVTRLLDPYDENTEVPEHDTPCYCVGSTALRAANRQVEEEFGSVDLLRQEHSRKFPGHAVWSEEADRAWAVAVAPRDERWKSLIEAHTAKDKPRPECESCNGSGFYKTTRNPKAQWDWWEMGGRWSGWLPHLVTPVRALPEFSQSDDDGKPSWPFGIVTPDGEWHQRAEMHWFAVTSNEKETSRWHAEVAELLSSYPKHHAVVVDCHI